MGVRADDGLNGADFVPPLLSNYLALGTRLGFYRKLRSHATRNMAHVDTKRTRTHRKVCEPTKCMRFRATSLTLMEPASTAQQHMRTNKTKHSEQPICRFLNTWDWLTHHEGCSPDSPDPECGAQRVSDLWKRAQNEAHKVSVAKICVRNLPRAKNPSGERRFPRPWACEWGWGQPSTPSQESLLACLSRSGASP
jgi:hypothetical protein